MLDPLKNKMFEYADDSTFVAAVGKPADSPVVTAGLNRDLVGIHERYNGWCMLFNDSKINA